MAQYPMNYGYGQQYGGFQQPMQPYQPMDRMTQLQQQYQQYVMPQFQQNQQTGFGLNGEVVDSIDVVKAKNVDMSGAVVYYPQSNGEAIYTKRLQADGTSQILTYRIAQDIPKEQTQPIMSMDILNGMFGQLKQDFSSEINELKELIYSLAPAEPPKTQRGGNQK